PQRGQRQADLVVERALRGDRRAGVGEQHGEQVLGAGLARGPGDADDDQLGQGVHDVPGQGRERRELVPLRREDDAGDVELASCACSPAASDSAATSAARSSNGWTTPATSCPCSWPLPATSTTPPPHARRTPSVIAFRRPDTSRTRAPLSRAALTAPSRTAA